MVPSTTTTTAIFSNITNLFWNRQFGSHHELLFMCFYISVFPGCKGSGHTDDGTAGHTLGGEDGHYMLRNRNDTAKLD